MPGQPGQAWPDPRGVPQAEPSDRDLLRRHVQGDTEAFGVLFLRHRDRLWAVALRTLGDQEEAADALQDAMISAFRRAADFRGDSAVTTWLHRIVVNACLDRIRRRAARPAASGMDEQTLDVLAQGSALADPGMTRTPRWTCSPRCGRWPRTSGPRWSWWTCSATRWPTPPRSWAFPRAR